MSAEVTLITKFGIDPLMSKRIFLDEQGALQSDGSQCLMIQGEAERVLAGTPGKLAEIIFSMPLTFRNFPRRAQGRAAEFDLDHCAPELEGQPRRHHPL
jgi:hypothetical protein